MTSREQNETKPQFTKDAIVPSQPNLSWWHCNFCGTDTASEEAPTDHKCANPNGCNAAPTPVPLEPREWLMDIAFVEKGDSDDVMTTISRIVQLLESYSSRERNRAERVESQLSTTQEALRKCQWKLYECGMELSYVQEAEVLSLCKSAKGEALCNEVMQLLGVDYSIETEEELHRVLSPPTKLP